jgi:hypothetical protein
VFNRKLLTSLVTVIAAAAAAIAIIALEADLLAPAGAGGASSRSSTVGTPVATPCEELPRSIDCRAVAQSMSLPTPVPRSKS